MQLFICLPGGKLKEAISGILEIASLQEKLIQLIKVIKVKKSPIY